jgi:Putative prokaryotic signal transducing protein
VEIGVRLTVVGTQMEADMICSLLRVNGIKCGERAADVSAEGVGGWREVLVAEGDLEAARELLAPKPAIE